MPAVVAQPAEEQLAEPTEVVPQNSLPASILSEKIPGGTVNEGYDFDFGTWPSYNAMKQGQKFITPHLYGQLLVEKEYFNSGRTIPHPTNKDMVFFSTDSEATIRDNGSMTQTSTVYLYDEKNSTIQKIFSLADSGKEYSLVGIDGSRLIMHGFLIDSSPGPCWNMWDDAESIKSLDLTDLTQGLQPYTVPQTTLQTSKKEAAACEKELGM